jgi:hypothetical protein
MKNEVDWKVAADLEVESTIPRERIIAAVQGRGSKSSGPRPKGYGKPSSKDAGPQQYKKGGKKSATQSGPREYKKGR